MVYFADTNILLRFLTRSDPDYTVIRAAARIIKARGDEIVTSAQNIAEFWGVLTRPASARGGYGLSIVDAERRLKFIEKHFPLLPDTPKAYVEWKRLVVAHGVSGVQVHDARLVALMKAYNVTHAITINTSDFSRYPGIITVTPRQITQR
jgi:predicted nucleic acid-binding protein